MRKHFFAVAALLALVIPPGVHAELPVGTKAPIFATWGALAGKAFRFNLKDALRKGPVVLYFYPKAFTQGCTLEAHAFAEAHDKFAEAGAMVVGMSADDIATLKRFSTEECRDKFAVAVADPEIIRGYDVALKREGLPAGLSNRTSYVIAPNGRITFVHSDLDYRDHVSLTLAAVQKISDKAR
ncbi:MAG: peroxiredoxin [Novosphingobium sp.]|nr:peroxiredoxin [Novosphingobium sp.]